MAKSAASNTGLVGIERFKSEVTKLLLSEKDHTLEICHFKLGYKKTFSKEFNHQKYGFSKKKFTNYFDDISDIVRFENERKFIVLKEKASVSQNKPTSSQASSSSESSRKDGNKKRSTTRSVQSVQTSKTTSSSTRDVGLIEPASKSATDVKGKKLVSPVPSETPPSGDSLSGIDRFKAKVKEILREKAYCKIEIGQFIHLYKRKFGTVFDQTLYGFERREKISELLGAIPDVVLLERIGGSLYMKLNNCSSSSMEKKSKGEEEKKVKGENEKRDDVHSGIKASTQAAAQVKSPSDSLKIRAKHNEQEQEKNRSGTERFDSIDEGLFGTPTSNVIESLSVVSSIDSELNSRTDSWGDRCMEDIPNSELESYPKPFYMDHPVPSNNCDSVNPEDTLSGVDLFKSEIKQLLLNQPNNTLDVGRFKTLYKAEFNRGFISKKYGFQGKKISRLLEKILDVVILEKDGSRLIVKLKDKSDSQTFPRPLHQLPSGAVTSDLKPQTTPDSVGSKQPDVLSQPSLMSTPLPAMGPNTRPPLVMPMASVMPGFQVQNDLPSGSMGSPGLQMTPNSSPGLHHLARNIIGSPNLSPVVTGLPARTMTTSLPATTMTTGLPATTMTTGLPATNMTTGLPAFAIKTGLPAFAIKTGLPVRTMTTGLQANTMITDLPATTMTTGLPATTMTTGLPATTMTTGLPATNMTTGLPAFAIKTGLPAFAIKTGLPVRTMTTGLPATTMTTGLPDRTMITGLPATTMTTGLPATTMTTGLPATTMTTGLPGTTMTTGLPATNMTTGLPAFAIKTGLPAFAIKTGLPVRTMTTGLLATTMTTGLQANTMVTGLPATTMTTGFPAASSSPSISSKKVKPSVLSFATIMQEQKEESLEESVHFPSLPPSTKPRHSKMRSHCYDADDEQSCLQTPGPFEESFNSAYDTPQGTSSLKKSTSRKMSHQEINEVAKQVVESISADGEHVSLEIVKVRLCKKLGVKNLNEFGFRKPDIDIPVLKELSRLLCKLDLYGRAYVMVHSISTLTELGQGMARLLEKKDFLDLQVGPLVKLPVVYDLFKAPSDDVIMQPVTTVHILKHLNQYLTKKEKWTTKVDLHDFMQFLCETYQCSTPYELGIRIQSVGLGISVLKRAQKSQSEKSKVVEQELAMDMEREIEKRCKKIKDDLLGSSHGDERSLLHKLLGTSVIEIITRIFDHCQPLFDPKPLKKVNTFLNTVTSDKPFRDKFSLAIHMGCKDIVKHVLEDYKAELLEEERKLNKKAQETASPPKKRDLLKEAKEWLNKAETLDLSTLATIEKCLLNRFPGFEVFCAFGYGTWLEFLNSEKELCKLLENKGASIGGGSSNSRHKVDLNSVLDFIIQCGTRATEDIVQPALCSHYHVTSVTDLGVKSYKTLEEQASQRKHVEQSVIYELALICKDGDSNILQHLHPVTTDKAKPRAGLLGWKTVNDAVKALATAPLLADLKEWTQWDSVFQPCLGDLKLFIAMLKERDDGIQLQALETEEGKLLKVNVNVSPDDLKKSVDEKDVIGTAGILVSLVIKYGGIQATPLALIVNHMKSALLTLASVDQSDEGQRCPRFILHCLCRLPHRMCVAVASKVFLEPLGAAVGTTLSNQLLLSCCENYQQRCCLHQLGLALGHTEWIEDFKSMMSGETENQVLEEERKKILQDLRPVAVVKPVTAEPIKAEEDEEEEEGEEEEEEEEKEKEDTTVQGVVLEEDQVNEPSEASETPMTEGTIDCQQDSNDEEEADTSEQNPCKVLIESIRREEFGIGVSLGKEESKLVQKQREREGRSLHRLSSELYSRDTHFVLELIQNADDNTFTEDSPTLVFVIEPHMVVVLNNEVGFKEENIRALCDVGKSTKGAHQYGYIGQKGIGFKSVFRVSDRPEVHSNGYHICFDANSGPSGYILPHWIDDQGNTPSVYGSKLSSNVDDLQPDSWMTRIVLPLKEEFHGDKKNSLSARFNDVHPSLLLFLHRLRKIILVKKNKVQQMTRQDRDGGIVQISDSQGIKLWLVVKKQLKAPQERENVEKTELALAFPMAEQENVSSHELHAKPFPVQNVFAYLPLRSYGFKFIIQGDFEVPSSREDVDSDKAWNQWLREEIPNVFIDALEVFKNHPRFPGLSGAAKFFQFVPLKEEILDFFNPVAGIILRHLQGMNCLPVEKVAENVNENGSSSQYDWMQPCKVVVCEDPDIVALISPELLYRHLALHYLVPDLISAINPALREELGIKTLSVKHLIDVGRSVIEGDSLGTKQDNVKKIQWISQWLCCVYRCLEREHNSSSEILDQIAAMNIFPLSDYTFVNLKDNAIFFPLSTNQQTMKEKKKRSTAKYLQELEKDLLVLNPELLNHLESVGHSQVEKLLQQLGVKSWTAKDVIQNHILPTLKSEKWKEKTNDVLQCYLVYIFNEHLSDRTLCDLDELKGCARVLTNKGPVNPSETPVHFTVKYGNSLNLSKDIPNISWTLINDSYLDETPTSAARQEWEKFFSALGVQHFLIIERRRVTLNKMTLDSSPWASYYESWQKTPDSVYVIDDFCCDELDEFMSKTVEPQQAKVLAENLDKQWKDRYSKYADKIPLKDSDGKDLYGHSILSSFLLALKTRAWLPVLQSNTCSVPSKLYLNSKEVYDVLDDHVQYVGANLQGSSFARILGVTLAIKLDILLDNLIEWSKTCQSKAADQERGFFTSLAHMKRVYQFIHEKYKTSTSDDKSKITSAFQKNPLIFFPHDSYLPREKQDQKREGKFYHRKEVCWKDPSDVAYELVKSGKYTAKRQILSTCYIKHYEFFRSCLEVDLTPHSDEYIEMASVLVNENSVPTPSVLEMIIEIFAVLGEKCLTRPLTEINYTRVDDANYAHTELSLEEEDINLAIAKYLKTKLATEDIFPCAARWVSLSDKLIVPDNKRLKKVFEGEKDVHFIVLEQPSVKSRRHAAKNHAHEKKMEFVQVFLRACGIPKLSACVEEALTTNTVAYQCHEVQQYFHQIVPCVQRYIYHLMFDSYIKLVENKFSEMLAGMTFAIVDKLEVVYYLKHLPQVAVVQQAKWGHEYQENKIFFYAVSNQVEIAQPLNQEIAKLFGAGGTVVDKKFENFLELLRMNLENDLEYFLLNQEVDSLPEEEEIWYVPAPEVPKTPEIVEEEILEPIFPTEKASSREYENDGTLHCWPPRGPVTGVKSKSSPSDNRPQEKALEMWPEPEAPSSLKNQMTNEESLPLQKNKRPAESYNDDNDGRTTTGGAVFTDVGAEGKGLVSNLVNNTQQSRSVKDQQKAVEPDGSVQKETTYPQVAGKASTVTGPLEQSEHVSHLLDSVQAESFSTAIFTPDMQVTVQDLEFDNLPTEDISLPDMFALNQNPSKEVIGRWGEQFVYEYLKCSQNPGDDGVIITDIKWMNEQQNSVSPYDIEIREKRNGADETITFIEVKSTSGEDKDHFEISAAELRFALEQKDKLHLYRVFNAGSRESVRIQRAMNLAAHLENKSVKLFMTL